MGRWERNLEEGRGISKGSQFEQSDEDCVVRWVAGGEGFVAECGFQRSQLLDASRVKESKKGGSAIDVKYAGIYILSRSWHNEGLNVFEIGSEIVPLFSHSVKKLINIEDTEDGEGTTENTGIRPVFYVSIEVPAAVKSSFSEQSSYVYTIEPELVFRRTSTESGVTEEPRFLQTRTPPRSLGVPFESVGWDMAWPGEDAKKKVVSTIMGSTSHEVRERINGGSGAPPHDEWGRSQFRCIEVAA
ncbi:hypothetical protein WN55_07354 [Dufourea novaeangliae]|uniref:Uncharacterized protein n=1 Tax=Dufourea novaeangliae TaxID=178035 RepID=A0A154PTK8_DUFNO|nr:hypothetical protein WN55_07354 [Dufourea novaeangliae]